MFYDFLHKVLKIPIAMRVRRDSCLAKNPEITVIFLHGIASSYAAWKEVLPPLLRDKDLSKVRFVAVDLIGFGKSEKPDWFEYNYAAYRKALTRTMKKLKIRTPIVLCGHSMGCLVAADYATNGDMLVDQLILISPPVIKGNEIAGLKDQIYAKMYGGLKNHTDAKPIGFVASFVDALTSFEKRGLNTLAFRKTMESIILNKENYAMMVNLKIPMEVIHGRFDPLVIGANLRKVAERNKYFHLTETFGGHDIVGAKAKKVDMIFKETMLRMLLQEDL
jgi:pimeloyl-ACP methyl ester carboxylesterase